MTQKTRTFRQTVELYHRYLHRTGFYKLMLFQVIKFSILIVVIIGILLLLLFFFIDLEKKFFELTHSLKPIYVFIIFFLSESVFLSIITPDLFILWADNFENKYLFLTLLGLISWLGGIASYYIGMLLILMPKVRTWVEKKFSHLILSVNKWGTFFIIIAALLPIPWSPALIATGMMNYPAKRIYYITLFRLLRFYIYGAIIFSRFFLL